MTTRVEKVSGVVGKMPEWDVERVRRDFPILATRMNGKPLVYLDNAATTQKPRSVIEAEGRFYETQNANVHRGVYQLSQVATGIYEATREKVRAFIHAGETAEIIYTKGTTEAINLVAASWGRVNLKAGDEVVVTHLEHHSNIVPWQMACEATGAKLRVMPITDEGELVLGSLEKFLASGRVKMVAVNHVSNSLGTVNPVKEIIGMAHAAGALVLIDGAQWVAHGVTDVRELDCDYYAFSGHKLMGPTGIGVLYGKRALLEKMPPYQGGGDMIASVRFEKTEYAELPAKFEAGTPNVAGVAGLGAAIDYLQELGLKRIGAYEQELLNYATERMSGVPGLRIVGTAKHKSAVISFVMEGASAPGTLDVGMQLDREGIAVRTGHHCCMPVMERFGLGSTARASFAYYNTRKEVDALAGALLRIVLGAKERGANTDRPKQSGKAYVYPAATAPSPAAAAEEIVNEFDLFGDWQDRYKYLIELGDALPAYPDDALDEIHRIHGCQATVYLDARKQPGSADRLEFLATANADIVRGLLAILQRLYSGQRVSDILEFDQKAFFEKLGLEQNLMMNRRIGLDSMVKRLRSLASIMHSTSSTERPGS